MHRVAHLQKTVSTASPACKNCWHQLQDSGRLLFHGDQLSERFRSQENKHEAVKPELRKFSEQEPQMFAPVLLDQNPLIGYGKQLHLKVIRQQSLATESNPRQVRSAAYDLQSADFGMPF